jgi:putative oxidoreductase
MNSLRSFYYWQEGVFSNFKKLESLAILLARLYVAKIFFFSGLTKIRDWDSTLFLFQEEYKVPLLPPELAAYLGAGGELLLPPLLLIGLLTRFASLSLFIVNIVAAISLPEITQAALSQHCLWAILLLMVVIHGGGKFTLDFRLNSTLRNR